MSLLSENVSQVAEAQEVQTKGLTIVAPPVSTHFPLLSGVYQQVVGYVAPRNDQYSYVLDLKTGAPLKLPENMLPTVIMFTAVQNLSYSNFIAWYVDSDIDPDNANKQLCDNLSDNRINAGRYQYQAENTYNPVSGLATNGYRWIVFENDDYPDPVLTGVVKVVQAYH